MFLVKGIQTFADAGYCTASTCFRRDDAVGRAVFKTEDLSIAYSVFNVLVEMSGLEPLTPCLQSRCSPS
jgi:hypothetical protein